MSYPCPIDFAKAWHDCTAQSPSHRGPAEVDLAFWDAHAAGYDVEQRAPGRFEGTLAALHEVTLPDDAVLDVGAGTGRFAIPLALRTRSVTVVDHSHAMLDVLRQRAHNEEIHNLRVIEQPWETCDPCEIGEHDVVLAAWSLYRVPDILDAMRKLVACTRRTLAIVCSAGNSTRHDSVQREIWPHLDTHHTPLHIYYYGVLWQAGYQAEIRLITERTRHCVPTPDAIALQLAPQGAAENEIHEYARRLRPVLERSAKGYVYHRANQVAMILWRHP